MRGERKEGEGRDGWAGWMDKRAEGRAEVSQIQN